MAPATGVRAACCCAAGSCSSPQLLLLQHSVNCTPLSLSSRLARSRQRVQRCLLSINQFYYSKPVVIHCDSAAKASGKARLVAGVEEEEFKGDVTDACVIDRGNGEYQVSRKRAKLFARQLFVWMQRGFPCFFAMAVVFNASLHDVGRLRTFVHGSNMLFLLQIQFKGTRPGPVEIDVILNGERVRGCPFMCHQLDISDWGTPEVVEWITELGFPEYAPMFEEQCVEGYMLVGLTLDDLVTSFRVDKMGHRNAILRAVRRLLFSDVSPANIKRIDEPTLVRFPRSTAQRHVIVCTQVRIGVMDIKARDRVLKSVDIVRQLESRPDVVALAAAELSKSIGLEAIQASENRAVMSLDGLLGRAIEEFVGIVSKGEVDGMTSSADSASDALQRARAAKACSEMLSMMRQKAIEATKHEIHEVSSTIRRLR